jgi:hypothetical protein
MIFMVIGAMLVHNLIIWRRKAITRRKSHLCTVIRMTQPQRWQHVLLFTSFFVLVFTGFALKFPDSWLATLLAMSERVRGWTHRTAGIVLIGVGVYHVFYILLSRDGRRMLADFFAGPKDAADVWRQCAGAWG